METKGAIPVNPLQCDGPGLLGLGGFGEWTDSGGGTAE